MYTPTEVIQHPKSTVVDLKRNATFICETNGGHVTLWRVNGTFINITSEMAKDVVSVREKIRDNTRLTLNITAKYKYNGTTVQCVTAVVDGDPEESDNATLTIRGIHTYMLAVLSWPPVV